MAVLQVHLLPAKVHQFGGSETVPEGQQHHGCVTMAPAVVLGRLNQSLDFALGEVFAGSIGRHWASAPAKQLRIFRRLDGPL